MKSSDDTNVSAKDVRIVREGDKARLLVVQNCGLIPAEKINDEITLLEARCDALRQIRSHLQARIAEQQAELDADGRSVHLLNSFYVNLVRDAKRAEAAEARVKELAVALNRVIYIAEQVRTELADFRVLAPDIPGPCDETPPLFSQGGEATTFYAGKKFDRDNQLGNDGLK